MNLETAQQMVKQWVKASDPSLTYLLDRYAVDSIGGEKYYRPFIVAAFMMRSQQKILTKADVATWTLQDSAYESLLELQSTDDEIFTKTTGLCIPVFISVKQINEDLTPSLGINVI
jgi:hypothetical protein